MPLLALKKLTVRFGGLTAVNAVDCALQEHQIVSVIGPNGAGKTTVFNAITGIYEPTAGSIEFDGHELARRMSWRVALLALVIGLSTALLAALAAVDVDRLWLAAIKRNYAGPGQPFSYRAAWHSTGDYLSGRLRVTSLRGGRWSVVTADGRRTLAYADSEAEAQAVCDRLNLLSGQLLEYPPLVALADDSDGIPLQGTGNVAVDRRGGRVRYVLDPGPNETVLAEYSSAAEARSAIDTLAAVAREGRARRRNATLSLLLGFALGAAGTLAVWNRSRRTPDFIARSGIARTFQNIRFFKNMTVLENVLTGLDRRFRSGALRAALRLPMMRREEIANGARAVEWLRLVGLEQRANHLAKNLSYGEQRRLEIARALATEPRVLLLDEPAAGMNPAESAELGKLIETIRHRGLSVLLIEHHMQVVMDISDRIAVLDYGSKIAEGTPSEVRTNPAVIKAYLGSDEVA